MISHQQKLEMSQAIVQSCFRMIGEDAKVSVLSSFDDHAIAMDQAGKFYRVEYRNDPVVIEDITLQIEKSISQRNQSLINQVVDKMSKGLSVNSDIGEVISATDLSEWDDHLKSRLEETLVHPRWLEYFEENRAQIYTRCWAAAGRIKEKIGSGIESGQVIEWMEKNLSVAKGLDDKILSKLEVSNIIKATVDESDGLIRVAKVLLNGGKTKEKYGDIVKNLIEYASRVELINTYLVILSDNGGI